MKNAKNVYDQAIKKSKFNFVVEWPIWVSIKRTFTGKLEAYQVFYKVDLSLILSNLHTNWDLKKLNLHTQVGKNEIYTEKRVLVYILHPSRPTI